MTEFWLILRGGLRILTEKHKGLEPAEETSDSNMGTRIIRKLQLAKSRKEGHHFLTALTLPSTLLDESSSSDLTTDNTQAPEYAGWSLDQIFTYVSLCSSLLFIMHMYRGSQ